MHTQPLRAVHLSLVLIAFRFAASAQIGQFEGKRIVDIRFAPNQPLDPADLAKLLPLKTGEPLRAKDVSAAIDSLFATGQFEDIVVEAEPAADGVAVRFVVQDTWFVGGVTVEGKVNAPPNRGQIASTAQLALGLPFHEEDVSAAVESITRLLESNGLYQARVTPSIERDNDAQQVFITLKIHDGKRAKYEMPLVEGDTSLSDNTVLRATGWRVPIIHWWRQVTDSRTRKGVQGLLGKYQSQDRLTAKVEIRKLDYDPDRRRLRPQLTVIPGPKVTVRAVEAKVSKRVLKRYVPIFQERSVDNDLLVEGKRNLSDYFQSRGYYDVDVDFRVQPPKNDVETIEYVISQGQRYKLISVSLSGAKYFSAGTIRERMFITPASFNLRRGRYSEAFRRKDEENIANLYQSKRFLTE